MGFEKLADLKQQLASEVKPSPKNAQKTIDPVVHLIARLQKHFPKAFPKSPLPKVPLKVGILDDVIAKSREVKISESDIKLAVKTWCRSKRYWSVIKSGAARIDLDGNEVGVVQDFEAGQARGLEAKNVKGRKTAE